MKIYLFDGTYELFRSYFGAPPKKAQDGREVGAVVGLLRSLLMFLSQPGSTHLACAFDHVIESFRNDLYPGYKSSQGVDPVLLNQFSLAEDVVAALGIVVWPMVEFEADDAIGTAATRYKDLNGVDQVVLCSPDKDLSQAVVGTQVVCWDRRRDIILDEQGVVDKFGVKPASIPDYLALVGDSSDGYPGVPGWGAKSAASVLSQFTHLENISEDPQTWGMNANRAARLAESLAQHQSDARLFKQLATLRSDVPLSEQPIDLEWRGAHASLKDLCRYLDVEPVLARVQRWFD